MDASLSRQFLRLKRSGVKPHTWLGNHIELMGLLVPAHDLQEVVRAAGEWECVASSIKNLIESSLVGRTVFSFCSQLVTASHYKKRLDELLARLQAAGFSSAAMDDFKQDAQKAADDFKAMGLHATCFLNHHRSLIHVMFSYVYDWKHATGETHSSSCSIAAQGVQTCFFCHCRRCFLVCRHPWTQALGASSRRVINIDYAGMQVKLEVRDPHTEWELRLAS